jgi:hypothetical protein
VTTDDELLERLAAAFAVPAAPVAPPAAGLRELHRAVDSRSAHPNSGHRPVRRLLPIAVATGVAAACVAVVLVLAATPRIGRETVTQVTVTVTSPAFGEVAAQQRALERALADGDLADVATVTARLRLALDGVTASELLPVNAEIAELLARADALLERRRGGNDQLPSLSSTLSSTAQSTVAPAAAPPPIGPATPGTSPAVPAATTAASAPSGSAETTAPNGRDADDNSGPGGGADVADDNSGPGGDDNSGPGGGGNSGEDNSGPGGDSGDSG